MEDVGHGCVDCAHGDAPITKPPCKGCVRWSRWVPSEKYKDRLRRRAEAEAEIMKGVI